MMAWAAGGFDAPRRFLAFWCGGSRVVGLCCWRLRHRRLFRYHLDRRRWLHASAGSKVIAAGWVWLLLGALVGMAFAVGYGSSAR